MNGPAIRPGKELSPNSKFNIDKKPSAPLRLRASLPHFELPIFLMKLLLPAAALAFLAAPLHAQSYTAIDLGTLGGTTSRAYGINASGQIVGYAYTSGNSAQHATLFSGTGSGNTDLGTLGGTDSGAYGINASGQIVGWATTSGNSAYQRLGPDRGLGHHIRQQCLPRDALQRHRQRQY